MSVTQICIIHHESPPLNAAVAVTGVALVVESRQLELSNRWHNVTINPEE